MTSFLHAAPRGFQSQRKDNLLNIHMILKFDPKEIKDHSNINVCKITALYTNVA